MIGRLARITIGFAVAAAALAVAWRMWRGPDPATILARTEVPPSPVLSPDEALARFRTAPGFRVELVAAEPLVVDPVAMDWDDEGRLYVVEMRGFMGDIDGAGEDQPVGRVVVLEDTDGDGRMDRSDVFLDGLVMPRAVAVLPEGVLVGSPPDLWLCRDTTGDRSCNERRRLSDYAMQGANPEHQENGLLAAIDGWIYNAKSSRRFRLRGDVLEVQQTAFRGQWGIAQDDEGRLFYNHNSTFLLGDAIPAEIAMRQAATAAATDKPGIGLVLAGDAEVHGVRVAPGLNRAYLEGTLRRDGRQRLPTAVSGIAIQRGDQYGPDLVGDAFVPEAAGAAVAHFPIAREGPSLRAEHRLYPDPDWGEREFLASTDERFRPVDADVGPDGAIWLIDMYRGVIQHAEYVSEHLRTYVAEHALAPPGATGRIWRIVREDRPITRRPPPLDTRAAQLAALEHPNGWVRDRAQRRLVHEREPESARALRQLDAFGPLARRHALFALAAMDALDAATWRRALRDADPEVRIGALRAGAERLERGGQDDRAELERLLADPDAAVRLQALHALGSLPPAARPLPLLLEHGRSDDPLAQQAALSGLAGIELAALRKELARTEATTEPDDETAAWLGRLAGAAHLAAREGTGADAALRRVLDTIAATRATWQQRAALAGIAAAQRTPGSRRIALAAPHPLFAQGDAPPRDEALAAAIARARRHFTWPGDPRPGGARPLTPEEARGRERGRERFARTCAACHGKDGRGLSGLAPPLVGSPWVRDSADWLVRIVLQGLTGPIGIDGEQWNATMPGHGHDATLDDELLAGLSTHLRRSWGHAEEPVSPETVARIRAETRDRRMPWTVDELLALPIEHRLDRYAGIYRVPLVGIELEVARRGTQLTLGRPNGPAAPVEDLGDGLFEAEGITVQFEQDASGTVGGARVVREGTAFPVSRVR